MTKEEIAAVLKLLTSSALMKCKGGKIKTVPAKVAYLKGIFFQPHELISEEMGW